VDVGDLPNHVKYCVPVWLAFFEQLSVHHRSAHGGARIPNNWYQSIWFKVVFDFLFKNKSCQNYVLTIPLCRGGRDEATGEKGVEIGRRNHPRAPARWLATRTDVRHASHASSSPGWVDPTRIPVDPTHVIDPDKDDVSMT
jgi:hypothetical protein